MKKFMFLFLAIAFISLLTFDGCKKDSTSATEESIQSSQDNALADGEFSSVFSFVDDQGEMTFSSFEGKKTGDSPQEITTQKSDLLPDCATVSFDSTTRTLTIDFGTTNCECLDGINRRGKIHAQFTGKFREINSSVTVTFEDYYVQDMHVTGTKTVTYLGSYKVSVVVQNASITTPNGTISWSTNKTIEKIKGFLTKTVWDDEYQITGSSSGQNREGVNFSVTVDDPLIKRLSCKQKDFVAGTLTIQNSNGLKLSIDYDALNNEGCNKFAKVTYNGKTKTITLR
jgi:hypothetical protein